MTVRSIVGLVVVACVLTMCAAVLADEGKAPETVTVTGMLSVEKNAEGAITGAKITSKVEDKEVVYNIVMNRMGKAMAEKLDGKKVEAKGTVTTKDDGQWLTVTSHKVVEAEKKAEHPH